MAISVKKAFRDNEKLISKNFRLSRCATKRQSTRATHLINKARCFDISARPNLTVLKSISIAMLKKIHVRNHSAKNRSLFNINIASTANVIRNSIMVSFVFKNTFHLIACLILVTLSDSFHAKPIKHHSYRLCVSLCQADKMCRSYVLIRHVEISS